MRGLTLAVCCAVACGSAWSQSRLSGVITSTGGDPVADAVVLARAGSPEIAVASAVSDSQGRYQLETLPEGRVTLSVKAQSYYTKLSGGLESESITRTCPAQSECPPTDFVMERANVLEGWLADEYGDPVQGVLLELVPKAVMEQYQSGVRRGRAAGAATSDDRGYFRIWDLAPGRYVLSAEQRSFMRRGTQMGVVTQEIDIPEGAGLVDTRVALKADANVFSIAGRIVGLSDAELERTGLVIRPIDTSGNTDWMLHTIIRDGKFEMAGLRRGEYLLRLTKYTNSGNEFRYLQTLTVDQDLTGLELRPGPPTGVRGRVVFVDVPEDKIPKKLTVQFLPAAVNTRMYERVELDGPDFQFEHRALLPGSWKIQRVSGDFFALDGSGFEVQEGQMTTLDLRISNQWSSIRGRIAKSGEAVPHYTVGIRGRERRAVQSDDAGGFIFEKLPPGEYEIAMWTEADTDVHDDETWGETVGEILELTVEPGFTTEIDLEAAP